MRWHSRALVTLALVLLPRPLDCVLGGLVGVPVAHAQAQGVGPDTAPVEVDAGKSGAEAPHAVLDAPPPDATATVAPTAVEAAAPRYPLPAPQPTPQSPRVPLLDEDPPVDAGGDELDPGVDRALDSGLALGTGVGSDNVFLGGHLAYYAQLPSPRWRLVLHAGGGVLYDDVGAFVGGARGGLYAAFGLRHRLVLGVYGGTLDASAYALHGVVIGQRRENGVGFSAGWEWMHQTGLYVRATVGPALALTPDDGLLRRSHRWLWQGNFFAVGYKLW